MADMNNIIKIYFSIDTNVFWINKEHIEKLPFFLRVITDPEIYGKGKFYGKGTVTVRKNYIKCDILIVFFGGFGLKEPKIFRRKSLKNVIKYIILSHFFEPSP